MRGGTANVEPDGCDAFATTANTRKKTSPLRPAFAGHASASGTIVH
jgi:hypothetical protein